MSVSPNDVKNLREKTGAGMMDCKKALVETSGDFEKAVDYLRKKGLADMQKKQSRVAAEGMIGSYIHHNGKVGVLVEVNCETDFVARNEEFQQLVKDIAMHIAAANPVFVKSDQMDDTFKAKEAEIYAAQLKEQGKPEAMIPKIVDGKMKKLAEEVCLYDQKFVKNSDISIEGLLHEYTLKLGEKMEVRRFVKFNLGEGIEKRQDNFAAEIGKMTQGK